LPPAPWECPRGPEAGSGGPLGEAVPVAGVVPHDGNPGVGASWDIYPDTGWVGVILANCDEVPLQEMAEQELLLDDRRDRGTVLDGYADRA